MCIGKFVVDWANLIFLILKFSLIFEYKKQIMWSARQIFFL